jgi:hypothetical protein
VLIALRSVAATAPSTCHDHAAKVLERAREDAADQAGADLNVTGPLDIGTGPSIRLPDLAVVEGVVRSPGVDGRYHVTASATAGTPLKTDRPVPLVFDPARLAG